MLCQHLPPHCGKKPGSTQYPCLSLQVIGFGSSIINQVTWRPEFVKLELKIPYIFWKLLWSPSPKEDAQQKGSIYFPQVSISSQADHCYINLCLKVHLSYFASSWWNLLSKVGSSWQDFYCVAYTECARADTPLLIETKTEVILETKIVMKIYFVLVIKRCWERTTLEITFKDILKLIEKGFPQISVLNPRRPDWIGISSDFSVEPKETMSSLAWTGIDLPWIDWLLTVLGKNLSWVHRLFDSPTWPKVPVRWNLLLFLLMLS